MRQPTRPERGPLVPPPLCGLCGDVALPFLDDAEGTFWRSPGCDLVFRDPGQRLSAENEAARYRQHDNRLDDPRYLAFLNRLAEPMIAALPAGARGLDFGCGPVPAMALLLERAGFPTRSWDRLFHPDPAPLRDRYDFVTCSEVLEHVPDVADTLHRLVAMLRPGGVLGIMTQLRDDTPDFGGWWYRRDPTHITFFSRATFVWIGRRFHADVSFAGRGVVLLRLRPPAS